MHDDGDNKFYLYDIDNYFTWKYIMDGPSWYGIGTRGCCHPSGTILTGSSVENGAKKIVLMRFDDGSTIELPDLPCSVADVGMVYDARTDILTIAGGRNNNGGQWITTSNVFQLRNLKTIIERAERQRYWAKKRNMVALKDFTPVNWDKLDDLPFAVSDPILVNDNEYLYVLGGRGNLQCARIRKGQTTGWQIICALPYPCDGENHGGAFYINQTVTLISVSHIMKLQNTGNHQSWQFTQFRDNAIRRCIPMLYFRRLIAVLNRGRINTVEVYNNYGNQQWQRLFRNVIFQTSDGSFASFGAAKFQVFKFNNTKVLRQFIETRV